MSKLVKVGYKILDKSLVFDGFEFKFKLLQYNPKITVYKDEHNVYYMILKVKAPHLDESISITKFNKNYSVFDFEHTFNLKLSDMALIELLENK